MRKITIEIKWAVIFAVMQMAWMFIEKLTGLHGEHIEKHPVYTNLVAIPSILVYFFALTDKRKKYFGGFMTYRQGLLSGLIMTAIITALVPLTLYITLYFITPEFFSNAIKYAVAFGKSTQQEAEQYFNFTNYLVQSLIFAPVLGLVTSAIVAIFTRRKQK
ncbi:MAG: DUF4199 domain-containing protein [Ignavibacteria bacterium]|jgi:hypothetical protein|nr:DUF4199 domain-containing protein [Ignavibacteria bacterium]